MNRGRDERAQPRETAYENRLIARLQAGDQEALGILFEMHVERVFAFARHLLGSREDAEEITSEAFLRAFERAASFRGECPFRGWLFGITRNLCLDRLRQPRLLLLEPEFADAQTDEGRQAAQLDTSLVVRHALEELEEDHRVILMLCDVEEWDAREVAVVLEKSLPATKSLLYRARRALRARLTELWEDVEDNDVERGEEQTMRCDEMRDLLDLHMDGELSAETTRKMERHLLRCQSCAYELHTLQQTRAMLREAVAPTETTAQFRQRALARLTDKLTPSVRPAAVNARQWTLPFQDGLK